MNKNIVNKKIRFMNDNKNLAFTIIETLIAIAILMVAISGPLTASFKGLSASLASKDSTIALYLTQDLMEYIKNIKDTNMNSYANLINSVDPAWMTYFNLSYSTGEFQSLDVQSGGPCTAPNWCYLDTTKSINDFNELVKCDPDIGNKCGRLYLDPVRNIYTHESSGNKVTPFYRRYQFKMHTPGQMYCSTLGIDSGCAIRPVSAFTVPSVVYTDAELIVETNWKTSNVSSVIQLKSDLYAVRR